MSKVQISNQLSIEFIRKLEQIECSYWMRYYREGKTFPTFSTILNGGLACAIPDVDILAMNRAIGLGTVQPIDESILQNILSFYRAAGSRRFFLQLPPSIMNDGLRHLLLSHGFVHHNNWTKLYRPIDVVDDQPTPGLSIRKIDEKEADNFGQLIFMSFDWEDSRLASWLATTVGQTGYHHYIVSKEGKDIAAGALFVEGEMASMAFAGTLGPFRGLGAQSSLLKKRLQEAFKLGAKYITAETAEHTDARPVRSFLNIRKAGFRVAYQRENWIYVC